MKGINYLTDGKFHKTAVVIDIQTYGEELQNFPNRLEAEPRRNEPTSNFNEVVE